MPAEPSSTPSQPLSTDQLLQQAEEGWGEGYTLAYGRADAQMTTLMHWGVALLCFGLAALVVRGEVGSSWLDDIAPLTWGMLAFQGAVAVVVTSLAWRAYRNQHSYYQTDHWDQAGTWSQVTGARCRDVRCPRNGQPDVVRGGRRNDLRRHVDGRDLRSPPGGSGHRRCSCLRHLSTTSGRQSGCPRHSRFCWRCHSASSSCAPLPSTCTRGRRRTCGNGRCWRHVFVTSTHRWSKPPRVICRWPGNSFSHGRRAVRERSVGGVDGVV